MWYLVQGKYALKMPMGRSFYVEIDKSKGQLAGSLMDYFCE
jgi:hypothetical protein